MSGTYNAMRILEAAQRSRRALCVAVVLGWALCLASMAHGQGPDWNNPKHFDPFFIGTRVELGPMWLFSADDNPAFALPDYDDSNWRMISADRPLASYNIVKPRYAWYRMHVHLPRKAHSLAIEMQFIEGSYELYANGVRLTIDGSMNAEHASSQDYLVAYAIPDAIFTNAVDVVIAIRFAPKWFDLDDFPAGAPFRADSIYLATGDAAGRDAGFEASHQVAIPLFLAVLGLLVGSVALALYLAIRSRPEYLAIAISLLAGSEQNALIAWIRLHPTAGQSMFQALGLGIEQVGLIEFVRIILYVRRSRWLVALEVTAFASYFCINFTYAGWLQTYVGVGLYFLPSLIVFAVLPGLLLRGLVQGNRDARVIFPAIAVIAAANYLNFLSALSQMQILPINIQFVPDLPIGAYSMDFWSVWRIIYCVTMLLFLVLRTIEIVREHARAAAELVAARTVQQVLIPEEIPTIAGFDVQCVYKPAGEVGGDFFQIVPIAGGGALIVVGDVSGKGMPAAMTVSLLVGTFRTLAHYTQSPGEILAAMNQRMMARSNGGFTTCIVIRILAGGTVTAANAGHIAPYINGQELALENGLPLGLSADSEYSETVWTLPIGAHLTLLTDGVVEAQSSAGELFGFERAAAISTEGADRIAKAAEQFGQKDDITVLTLTFGAATEALPAFPGEPATANA